MDDIKIKLSEDFGIDIMKLADYLEKNKVNSAIITQILKSGTSNSVLPTLNGSNSEI